MDMNILFRGEGELLWFENSRGLVFTEGGRTSLLAGDCKGEFDLAFCGELNVVYLTEDGELVRLERRGYGWSRSSILKSRSGEMAVFGLRLIVSESGLNLIYGLKHNGENLIVHQKLSDSNPQVVQSAGSESFFVRRDESGCIHLISEAAEGVWHLSVNRFEGWSRPEELLSGKKLLDVMCTGYKTFCTVTESEGVITFQNGDNSFAVTGKNPSIVIYGQEYVVVSEDRGQIFYTGMRGCNKIISSGNVKDFHVRLPDSGEYALCESCRGSVIRGRPRLFLIDNTDISHTGSTARLEMTKQIIGLEAKIAELEKRIAEMEQNRQ